MTAPTERREVRVGDPLLQCAQIGHYGPHPATLDCLIGTPVLAPAPTPDSGESERCEYHGCTETAVERCTNDRVDVSPGNPRVNHRCRATGHDGPDCLPLPVGSPQDEDVEAHGRDYCPTCGVSGPSQLCGTRTGRDHPARHQYRSGATGVGIAAFLNERADRAARARTEGSSS